MKEKHIDARQVAFKIIKEAHQGRQIQEVLPAYLQKYPLSRQDRQFCADLTYGYLRTSIRLDYIITKLLPNPGRLPRDMGIMLGIALYSLLYQKNMKEYAAIDECVKMVAKKYGRALGNVANGALRAFQRLGGDVKSLQWYEEKGRESWRAQAIFYSCPFPVAELWVKAYGQHGALCLMRRSSGRPWHGLRFNSSHPESASLLQCLERAEAISTIKIAPYAMAFPPGELPEKICGKNLEDLLAAGIISLQSPASMLIMEQLELDSWQDAIWDCCAGSGIKTACLLEKGKNVDLVSDISIKRLKNIVPFCEILNLPVPNIIQASAMLPPLRVWHGNILADVPCSGLGILARRPDIRLRLCHANFWAQQVHTQKKILDAMAACLQPGKQLAYITCTLNPAENGEMMKYVLQSHKGLELAQEWQTPHCHEWLEGMYGAVLRKKNQVV